MPQQQQATRDLVWRVEEDLGVTDRAQAEKIADWAAQLVEDTGAARASMHFDNEGAGPWCSWCGSMWGMCVHGNDSEWYKADDDCAGCGHAKDGHDHDEGKCRSGDTITHMCKCTSYTAPDQR